MNLTPFPYFGTSDQIGPQSDTPLSPDLQNILKLQLS